MASADHHCDGLAWRAIGACTRLGGSAIHLHFVLTIDENTWNLGLLSRRCGVPCR